MQARSKTAIIKRLAFPLVCGMMLCATGAFAQVGDIVGFRATSPFYPQGYTFDAPGVGVPFTIRLAGSFKVLPPAYTPILYPTIQVRVGTSGGTRWATLVGHNYDNHGTPYARTDLHFEYVIRPGDMATPLTLAGSSVIPFSFSGGDFTIENDSTGVAAVWQVNQWLYNNPGGFVNDSDFTQMDYDMAKLDFKVKTLYFNTLISPTTIIATESKLCRIEMGAPSTTEAITLKVWTPNGANLQIAGLGMDNAATVTIPVGATYVDFLVKGLANGAATIYAQRSTDYNNVPFVSEAGITNFIKHVINITPPPEPTVRVVFPSGLDTLEINETTIPNTGQFKIALSEQYPNDVYVQIEAFNYPGETNITLTPPAAGYYRVRANQWESDGFYQFSAVDGTWNSTSGGVEIRPTVTNVTHYTEYSSGIVYVQNVLPEVTPTGGAAAVGSSFSIGWDVSDVGADIAGGIIMQWNFGDGTPTVTVTNYAAYGDINHTYLSTGIKSGYVRARDKDTGTFGPWVPFTVDVSPPVPTPSVSIIVDSPTSTYTEGTIGQMRVVLSEPALDATTITLTAELNGIDQLTNADPSSNSLAFAYSTMVIPKGGTTSGLINITFLDGTPQTAGIGVVITPTVTGTPMAVSQYPTMNETRVYINNALPTILFPLPSTTFTVPLALPFTYTATIGDVDADVDAGFVVEWQFESGGWTAGTGSGATYSITHAGFTTIGTKTIQVRARDKDGGQSAITTFTVSVLPAPPVPSVTVVGGTFPECTETGGAVGGNFNVMLSESHTQPVRVNLTVTPPTMANPGQITVSTTSVVFQPGYTSITVPFTIQDGTLASNFEGFTITPSIPAGDFGEGKYTAFFPGWVYVMNVAPTIVSPKSGSTNIVTATVGLPCTFSWSISDVAADRPSLTNRWNFGDGSAAVITYGDSGIVTHTFTEVAERRIITLETFDKDGLSDISVFFITVYDAKRVIVTPVGPNTGSFFGLPGLGWGTVSSPDIIASPSNPLRGPDFIYTFYFAYTRSSALFYAHPQPVPNEPYDPRPSFFFVWEGDEALFITPEHVNLPLYTGTTNGWTAIRLATPGGAGQGSQPDDTVAIRAIFSREWDRGDGRYGATPFVRDNCGDINQDGIPDWYVNQWFAHNEQINGGAGGAAGAGINPIWLRNLSGYNDDGDYYPANPYGAGGVWDFRPIPNGQNAFTAFLECRGEDGWLGIQTNTQGRVYNDDPGTDPTVADTDEDGYPDGWEYWFWARAYNQGNIETGRGGWRYNPLNVAQGDYIEPREIMEAFNPTRQRAVASIDPRWLDDFDNDGLLCIEELVLGTDPTNWDTDGDGMADGWEVLMGLNPCNSSDGLMPALNNPDGDFFAIAAVPRLLVTIVTSNEVSSLGEVQIVTNRYLARSVDGVLPLAGSYTACYRYGDDNAPWAVGLPLSEEEEEAIDLSASEVLASTIEEVNALLLHFQVRDEFGYDPRTAWCRAVPRFGGGTVNGGSTLGGLNFTGRWGPINASDAPRTRPFTAVDEYLLMKFMFELRLNGAAALHEIDPDPLAKGQKLGVRSRGADDWLRFSTHPKTPETSARPDRWAGVPDGWKLYVANEPNSYGPFAHSPWSNDDGTSNVDGEINPPFTLQREFWGTDSLQAYANPAQYAAVVPYGAGELQPGTGAPEAAVILFRTGLTNNISLLGRVWTASMMGVVTIARPDGHPDNAWINKFWPTDPWNWDTDGDGLCDNWERTFIYGNPVDDGSTCIPGGGLNPCSVDTDGDGLPDGWEVCFAGTPTQMPEGMDGGPSGQTMWIRNGMDGTVIDDKEDWDRDGLLNFEEYLTQAIRAFRYDIPDAGAVDPYSGWEGLPMSIYFEVADVFTPVTNVWDQARTRPPSEGGGTLWFMLPPETEGQGIYRQTPLYASTDPTNADTDQDGMDDFYELFHGLNPLLGGTALTSDRVAWAYRSSPVWYNMGNWWVDTYGFEMNFVRCPWLNGLPMSDADADGLLNLEEMLLANSASPQSYNTDPSPLWMTDISNVESITARFYRTLGSGSTTKWAGVEALRDMYFWYPITQHPLFYYGFEMNEGYDTDNDGVSDKDELVGNRGPKSDPRNSEDPYRRQALWFNGGGIGVTPSAAVTPVLYSDLESLAGYREADIEQAFRSFTVELWAKPERTTGYHQVLIERVFNYGPSDLSSTDTQRRNFLIGIGFDGRVYGGYDNAGGHEEHTDTVRLYGPQIPANEWTHFAIRMDGRASKFTLFVNGIAQGEMDSALVPVNGVRQTYEYPVGVDTNNITSLSVTRFDVGALVLGAANNVLSGLGMAQFITIPSFVDLSWTAQWTDFDKFYRGWLDEVRVWDGARSNSAIFDDYKRRLTHDDLMNNRELVLAESLLGASREQNAFRPMPPMLMNYYTFNSIFSAREAGYVAKVPRGFNNPAVVTNRPYDSGVAWWGQSMVRSEVYDDYQYIPWIQNVVAHLPLYDAYTYTNNLGHMVYGMDNVVIDSMYWRKNSAGGIPVPANAGGQPILNTFPNANNPYAFVYRPYLPGNALTFTPTLLSSADLLPLGYAYAKQCIDFWDGEGPTAPWLENSGTGDYDVLPGWWVATNGTTWGWNDLYSGDNGLYRDAGMENGEAYQRDLALGWGPDGYKPEFAQTADSDGDGLPDWWERLYGLDPLDPTGDNGAGGDPDLDGLSNYAEYLISEVYKFRISNPRKFKSSPGQKFSDYFERSIYLNGVWTQSKVPYGFIFSDHDFVEDWWEDLWAPLYANRFVYDPHVDYNFSGWSNWATARYNLAKAPVRADTLATVGVTGTYDEIPIPTIKLNLTYGGLLANGPQMAGTVIVQGFSDPEMNGAPDAVWALPLGGAAQAVVMPLGPFEANMVTKMYLSPGHIVPGTFQFRYTDKWRPALTTLNGFDRNGVIYENWATGWDDPIGTINYDTGEVSFDLAPGQNGGFTLPGGMLWVKNATVEVMYSYRLPNTFPQTLYLGRANTGFLREGQNYFLAYLATGTGGGGAAGAVPTWAAGAPFGVATPFGTDVGWDMNTVDIELADYKPGYLRMTLDGTRAEDAIFGDGTGGGGGSGGGGGTGGGGGSARVRVIRTSLAGAPMQETVLDKVIVGRDYIHEGDIFNSTARGGFGLDWGGLLTESWAGYEVYLGNVDVNISSNNTLVASFTNGFYSSIRHSAVLKAPMHGGYVYSARPTFRWSMPDEYTAFAIQLRKSSASGTVVYSGVYQAPPRNPAGDYVWEAPFYMGGTTDIVNNGLYYWYIVPLNARHNTPSWPSGSGNNNAWQAFRWDVNQPMHSSNYGQINATVKYFGPATSLAGKVYLEAFDNRGFTGNPAARYVLPAGAVSLATDANSTATNAFLRGLAEGTYYVRAFIDSNGNDARDIWESWGYANYYGEKPELYNVRPVEVKFSSQTPAVTVIIEDCDVDQDWFPDAWEYEQSSNKTYPDFLKSAGPQNGWSFGDAEINPLLNTTAGWTGWDVYNLLPKFASGEFVGMMSGLEPANDGFSGAQKQALGLGVSDILGLRFTQGPRVDPDSAQVKWEMSIEKDKTAQAMAWRSLASEVTEYVYQVRYSPVLDADDSQWVTVSSGTFILDEGVKAKTDTVSLLAPGVDPSRGFFKVRILPLPQQ